MPKHSPEPWNHVGGSGITRRSIILYGHTGACKEQHIAKDVSLEDADRIVACVNHLKGMPTSVLAETAVLSEMFPTDPEQITAEFCADFVKLTFGRKCKVEFTDEPH